MAIQFSGSNHHFLSVISSVTVISAVTMLAGNSLVPSVTRCQDQVVCNQSWFVSRRFMNRAIFDRQEHLFNAHPTKLYPNPARMSDTDDPETFSVTVSLRNGLKWSSMVPNGSQWIHY
jgi:hypothetical protein